MEGRLIIHAQNSPVVLRQFIPEDAELLFRLIDQNREHLSRWGDETSEKYPDLESVEASIIYPVPSRLRFGVWVGERLVGTINLTTYTDAETREENIAEIGYWIGKQFCGNGYAKTAARMLTDYALSRMDFRVVIAQVRRENYASRAVLERVGFIVSEISGPYFHFSRETLATV